MKETKYRFWSGDRSYTGYGYTETRCRAILDMLDSGWPTNIDKVEAWSDSKKEWVEISNLKI